MPVPVGPVVQGRMGTVLAGMVLRFKKIRNRTATVVVPDAGINRRIWHTVEG